MNKKDGIATDSTIEEKPEIDVQDNDFDQETSYNGSLFMGHYFYVSREVPLYLVKFIIEACGGACGWDQTALGNSPIDEQDSRITIQITDRPSVSNMIAGREYLQPQWIYDCVNANKLVKTSGYHVGEKLPPHLSPFVVAGADDYVPGEVSVKVTANNSNKAEPEQEQEPDEQEETKVDKDLAKIMMSKRERKLYDKMQYGIQKKKLVAAKLRQKAMQ